MTNTLDDMFQANAAAFKFDAVGDTAKGTVTGGFRRQATDIDNKPKVWPNGDPVMQDVITLQQEDGEETTVYCKWEASKAITAAIREAGADKIEVGGKLAIRYTGDEENPTSGRNAKKLFAARYEPPAPKSADLDDNLFAD